MKPQVAKAVVDKACDGLLVAVSSVPHLTDHQLVRVWSEKNGKPGYSMCAVEFRNGRVRTYCASNMGDPLWAQDYFSLSDPNMFNRIRSYVRMSAKYLGADIEPGSLKRRATRFVQKVLGY